MRRSSVAFSSLLFLGLAHCSNDFAPFNQLDGLRVLAIKAEPPDLAPGESTELSALLYVADGPSPTLEWSWCPATGGAEQGYACALTQSEAQQIVNATLAAETAVTLPAFDLGASPQAVFTHPFTAGTVEAICAALAAPAAARGGAVPDCTAGLTLSISLRATSGEEEIVAVKELRLLPSSESERNRNPQLSEMRAGLAPASLAESAPMVAAGDTEFARGQDYDLFVPLPDVLGESYEQEGRALRESLVVTWFVTAGETDRVRTVFIDGRVPMADAEKNTWTTPDAASWPANQAPLYVVVRDDRGGVDWLVRSIRLADEQK